MLPSPWVLAGVFLLGVLSGFLNTLAAGGTLLTLPLLTLLGLDLAVANGTNRVAILLQSVAGAWAFRREGLLPLRRAFRLAVPATLGALCGTLGVLRLPREALSPVAGAIILLLALSLLFRPSLWETPRHTPASPAGVFAALFLAGAYGGFLQAGVGIVLSWALVGAGGMDLVRSNGVRTVLVGCYTLASLALFLRADLVNLPVGLVLAGGSMVGAVLGARASVSKGNPWIRRALGLAAGASALQMLWQAPGWFNGL